MTTTTMTLTPDFDLVVRNAVVITASEEMRCDIGVRGGRIVALAETLGPGQREIDAAGRWVLPGGVDAHCHLDQPLPPPARMADGFESGTRSAACGGTTTVIPFAAQAKGQSLRDAVALSVDWQGDPLGQLFNEPARNAALLLRGLDTRAGLLKATSMLEEAALDRYTFARDAFLQNRRNNIFDGNPPQDDAMPGQ